MTAHWHEPAYVDDLTLLDTEAELLAEAAGLNDEQAELVIAWLNKRRAEDAAAVKAQQLSLILSMLMPGKDATIEAVITGLLAAAGILELAGFKSQAEAARSMSRKSRCPKCGHTHTHTVTRALVSHYAVRWADMLGIENTRYCRSRETRAKCAEAH